MKNAGPTNLGIELDTVGMPQFTYMVRDPRTAKSSPVTSHHQPLGSLTAAATRLSKKKISPRRSSVADDWQDEAWQMYDQVGEQRFLASTLAGRVSQARLFVGRYNDQGDLEELDDELPHSLAVVVDSIEYPEDNETGEAYDGKVEVIVSIYVERDSQKPIIIGKGAEHLVRVKKKLRTPVNRIVGRKAKLDLHVKVAKGWQSDPKQLERLGF